MHTARLQYDRIIITGASSGFGEAFAGTLAPHTAELVLIARNEAALRQLAAALENAIQAFTPPSFPATWRTKPP